MKPPAAEPGRAVVTGGAGFIGSHLVEALLRRGARVAVIDDLSSGRAENLAAVGDRVELARLDLAREDARPPLAGADTVFHLAGYADIPRSVHEPRRDFEKNAMATLNLLEAVREAAPLARVLFASSAAVYGVGSERPLREDDPPAPAAPYGVSKMAAERYVEIYARLYRLRTASLRLFPVYGPRLRAHVVYDLMRKLRDDPKELRIEGDGTQVRDFVHVSGAVEAFLTVAERAPLGGEAYNVASGEPVTIGDLATLICARMGVRPRFSYSGLVASGVSQRWSADLSRLWALGYRSPVSLDEGLRGTVEWFRGLPAERA
jgi:UDP-glucose 4-epimerase